MTEDTNNQEKRSEYDERTDKLSRLREKGIASYPAHAKRSHTVGDVLQNFADFAEQKKSITLVGRIRSKRTHGNLTFIDLEDASGRIQVALSKKECAEPELYKAFVKLVDTGDFVQMSGALFLTEAGQQTLMTGAWRLLTKALRNMPTDHFGFKDDDERYRKRFIDFTLSPDQREIFKRRAKFWQAMRAFMEERDFMHVETPTLEVTTGGAEARPFSTHHNDYDVDLFMRISIGELWQKRLMAGGFEKTYEIGRAYRNEGTSPNHLQEFTNMEFYWAYADYNDGMKLVTDLYRHIAEAVYGTTKFETRGHTFDLAHEWKEIDYREEILRQTDVDVLSASGEDIEKKLDQLGVKHDADNRERLIDNLWKYCRQHIAGPAFLVRHPAFLAPLSKRSAENPDQVEKFQVILAGAEVGNGYSELNDPIDQRERFIAQQKLIEAGDDEAMMPDWDFVEMLEYGMPPTCGFGAGERLFAFFEDKTVRETTLFPLMKPRERGESGPARIATQSVAGGGMRDEMLSKTQAEKLYRSKKIVVIADEEVGYGVSANAIGQLGVEIGMFSEEKLHGVKHLIDADERKHYVDSLYPMANLSGTQKDMVAFVMKCHEEGIQIFDFSDIMRRAHSDKEMLEGYAEKKTEEIGYIAVGAVVPKDFEKEFLEGLALFGSKN